MLSPECTQDLNAIMNFLNKVGYQYKSDASIFKFNREIGIYTFLKWEEMERYEYADILRDYMINNQAKPIYSDITTPTTTGANIQTLNALVELEKMTVVTIDSAIASTTKREAEVTKSFMMNLRCKCQHQYNEVFNIVAEIAKVSNDPGAMNYYNNFLENKFASKYSNSYEEPSLSATEIAIGGLLY